MKKVSEFKNERELQEDLSDFFKERGDLTYTEIALGGTDIRADLIAMTPYRYNSKDIRLYEVKFTRGAWLSDKKYQKYLDYCNRMYIACPKGLIKKSEVPEEMGLITRNDNTWRVIKTPRLNIKPPKMDVDFILGLLYRGVEENRKQRDLRDRIVASSNANLKEQALKIGLDFAEKIANSSEEQVLAWVDELWDTLEKYGYKKPEELLKQDKIYNRMSVQLPDLYI